MLKFYVELGFFIFPITEWFFNGLPVSQIKNPLSECAENHTDTASPMLDRTGCVVFLVSAHFRHILSSMKLKIITLRKYWSIRFSARSCALNCSTTSRTGAFSVDLRGCFTRFCNQDGLRNSMIVKPLLANRRQVGESERHEQLRMSRRQTRQGQGRTESASFWRCIQGRKSTFVCRWHVKGDCYCYRLANRREPCPLSKSVLP